MPRLFIIAGCNGAGKTTAAYAMLPGRLQCEDYVNSDEIAKGLSPFRPSLAAIKASKIMMERIHELIEEGKSFGVETTLSTKTLAKIAQDARKKGYMVNIIFFWLRIPERAIERVRLRVASGGHDVPDDTIRRRFGLGIDNLFHLYIPICDYWMIVDNSNTPSRIVAEGGIKVVTKIHDRNAYNLLLDYERARDKRT